MLHVDALRAVADLAGIRSRVARTLCFRATLPDGRVDPRDTGQRKPDIEFFGITQGNGPPLVDVGIAVAGAVSNVLDTAHTIAGAAARYERDKTKSAQDIMVAKQIVKDFRALHRACSSR